jgi:hypothetical protein
MRRAKVRFNYSDYVLLPEGQSCLSCHRQNVPLPTVFPFQLGAFLIPG